MRFVERLLFIYRNVKSKFIVGLESISYEKQVAILYKYRPIQDNNFERSYSQFLCHKTRLNHTFYICLNVLMIIPLIALPLIFIVIRIFQKRKNSYDAIYFYKLEIIPELLIEKYTFEKSSGLFSMKFGDLFFFNRIFWKHPLSFYYNFTVLICINQK